MGEQLVPRRPVPMPLPSHRTTPNEWLRMISATTDVTSLASLAMDAYRLKISLERDIVHIKEHYAEQRQRNQHIHEEIMLALAEGFEDRKRIVASIEKVAIGLIDAKEYQMAHTLTMQLSEILKRSPIGEVYSKVNR